MPASKDTQAIVDEISKRIEDLYIDNEDHVATALSLVVLKVLNSKYKPTLTSENVRLIKENYPKAIPKDIEERGLSEIGLLNLLTIFQHTSIISMDYSPLTNAKAEQDADLSIPGNQHKAQELALHAYESIKGIGYSSFGSATTLIMLATVMALRDGVSPFKISRSLLEAYGRIFKRNDGMSEKEIEKAAIEAVCSRMGISKKEAQKYLKAAKEMMQREEE